MEEIDHVFRYPVKYHGDIPVVSFVRYYRKMYSLPENSVILKGWNVCFQVLEEADKVMILFNRKYDKKKMVSYRLFRFNGVWCIKLGGIFWDKLGCGFTRDLYLSKNDDTGVSISSMKTDGGKLIQTFGKEDSCILPLGDLIGDSDDVLKDYIADFKDGICNMLPVLYPGEIKLIMSGNGILLPLDSFYDKIKREVEDDKTLVSIRFNDKDKRIEFIK